MAMAMAMSAIASGESVGMLCPTVVVAEAVLFDGFGSGVVDAIVTVSDGVVAGPLLVTERSALALTSVDAELLFPGVGSGVVEATVAVLVTVVPFAIEPLNVTVTVKAAAAPAGNEAMVQVTVGPVVQ